MPDASTNSKHVLESQPKTLTSPDKELSALKEIGWFIDSAKNPRRLVKGILAVSFLFLISYFSRTLTDFATTLVFGQRNSGPPHVTVYDQSIHVETVNLQTNTDPGKTAVVPSAEATNRQPPVIGLESLSAAENIKKEHFDSVPRISHMDASIGGSPSISVPKPVETSQPEPPTTVEVQAKKSFATNSQSADPINPTRENRGDPLQADDGAFAALNNWLKGKDTEK